MRVLYFTRDYTPHDHRFLSALVANGCETFSLRLERRGVQREDRPLPSGVTQVNWAGGRAPMRWQDMPGLLAALRRVLRDLRPDVVHAGTIQTAAFLTALAGFHPLVSMSWGSDLLVDSESSSVMRQITRYTLARTDLLLGDCLAVQEKAAAFGFPSERVALFPWGVDLQHFAPQAGAADDLQARLGWQDAFVLLSNRAWEPVYGVDVIMRGFAQAARQRDDLRLLLLGNGSLAAPLKKMILDAGLMERVHFGGHVNHVDLPRFYCAADLYLSASHSDGSSVSLLEALACARPALVSDISGNREWVLPGEQGWLFPDGDADALAEGILQAAAAPEKLPEMGHKARQLAEQRADWHKNVAALPDIYRRAQQIAGKGRAA